MKSKDYIYLPGGNPKGAFTQAAREIMARAMPYMGRYNDLYKRNSRPYKSVARGLSEDLGIEVGTENLFFGHGVKEAMQFSARFVNWMARHIQESLKARGIKPPKIKMLVKAPTYKHVLSQFQGYDSFECKLISSFSNHDAEQYGNLHHFNLLDELEFQNPVIGGGEFEYTIGYLDINPCNPSGHIRGLGETREIAHILELARIANKIYLNKVFRSSVNYKREPFVLIEDHIYRGLEHKGNKTVSFCQIDKDMESVTHTVFGVAKYGLVGMRGSVTIAPKFDVDIMQDWFEDQNSDVSPFSVLSCEYMFGDNPNDKTTRERYLKRVTAEYERNILIATAIIDGKARDFLTPVEYQTATDWLTKFGKMTGPDAHKLLKDGIKGIDTVNLPRAGFFLLLNFDRVIDYSDDFMDSESTIEFVRRVAHHQLSMHIGDAEYMGLDKEYDAVIRFTVALTPAELVKRLLRLRDLSEVMEKIGPLNSRELPNRALHYTGKPFDLAPHNCLARIVSKKMTCLGFVTNKTPNRHFLLGGPPILSPKHPPPRDFARSKNQ